MCIPLKTQVLVIDLPRNRYCEFVEAIPITNELILDGFDIKNNKLYECNETYLLNKIYLKSHDFG